MLSTLTLDSLSCEYGHLSSIGIGSWITLFQRAGTDSNTNATFMTKLLNIDLDNNVISVNYVPSFKMSSGAVKQPAHVYVASNPKLGTESIGSGAYVHGYDCIAMEDATAFGVSN
jgi:hypothetical protein